MSKIWSINRGRAARWLGVMLLFLSLPMAAPAPAAESAGAIASDDPSTQPSEILPRAVKSLLLDVAHTEAGFVAVGERGHVLLSSDGKTWAQVQTPTRSTLTVVTSIEGQLWAAGHDGVILHSADGGKSWQAQRRDPYQLAAGENPADHDIRQGVPILDIAFADSSNGIAVGAYNLVLITHDGGATWSARQAISSAPATEARHEPAQGDVFSKEDLQLGEESDPHLNSIAHAGGNVWVIAGERGTFLRSTDNGEHWLKLAFPYAGSMFGVMAWDENHLLAFGLRGNVYESFSQGLIWTKVDALCGVALMGGIALPEGGAVLVGANGTVRVRAKSGLPFVAQTYKNANGETPYLAGVILDGNGDYLLVGDKGVDLYHPQ
jgi:photosystem II stability/assembly factor-like uncharacterized protein